jgi:hypothetical protein
VISAYGEKFVKSGRMPTETHQWLREAFDQRIVGDYRWEVDLSTQDMKILLSHARIFKKQAIVFLEGDTNPTAQEPHAVYKSVKAQRAKPKVKSKKRKP